VELGLAERSVEPLAALLTLAESKPEFSLSQLGKTTCVIVGDVEDVAVRCGRGEVGER
jgi:hypothetical protein